MFKCIGRELKQSVLFAKFRHGACQRGAEEPGCNRRAGNRPWECSSPQRPQDRLLAVVSPGFPNPRRPTDIHFIKGYQGALSRNPGYTLDVNCGYRFSISCNTSVMSHKKLRFAQKWMPGVPTPYFAPPTRGPSLPREGCRRERRGGF